VHSLENYTCPLTILRRRCELACLSEFVQVINCGLDDHSNHICIACRQDELAREGVNDVAALGTVFACFKEDFVRLLRVHAILAQTRPHAHELVDDCGPVGLEAVSAILFGLDLFAHKNDCIFKRAKMIPRVHEPLGDLAALITVVLQDLCEWARFLRVVRLDLVVRVELRACGCTALIFVLHAVRAEGFALDFSLLARRLTLGVQTDP